MRKTRTRLRAGVIVAAVVAGLALVQINRHRQQGNNAFAAVQQLPPSECTPAHAPIATSDSAHSSPIMLRLDYEGADGVIDALERDSLSDTDVDSLLRIPGLCAMVANVGRFIPEVGVAEFRNEIRTFARKKKGGAHDPYFHFSRAWDERSRIRSLIAAIQSNERSIVDETISQLERYRPDSGTLAVTAYFVAGGVSDGFAFEHDATSLYANLVTADGDLNGVISNMAHEAYHVMQFRAQEQAGIDPRWVLADTMPPVERLLAGTLVEGTANYVVDPTRSTVTGSNIQAARQRYRRNADPKRIEKNFALFDAVLMKVRNGRMTWDAAYREGFTSDNDAAFYFVGYEMAKAIERYCGRECFRGLFAKPPVEFFRQYIALYHKHAELAGRFSQETEKSIAAYDFKSRRWPISLSGPPSR